MIDAPTNDAKPMETLPVLAVARGEIAAPMPPLGGGADPGDIAGAFASNTRAAYAADWRDWAAWCERAGRAALPADPAVVRDYLLELAASRKMATVRRRVAAIAAVSRLKGLPFDRGGALLTTLLKRLAREHGTAQHGRAPLLTGDIRALLKVMPATLQGLRDRAVLLLMFAAALRRSEVVALDVSDLDWRRDGLVLAIRRSKGDQDAEGQSVGVVYGRRESTCPVRALKRWLEASGIADGPVFRPARGTKILPRRLTDEVVYLAIKKYGARAGLDASQLGGHSPRAGHVTQALDDGADPTTVQATLRHQRLETTLRYDRSGPLRRSSSGRLGL